jgi:hypothetical protein
VWYDPHLRPCARRCQRVRQRHDLLEHCMSMHRYCCDSRRRECAHPGRGQYHGSATGSQLFMLATLVVVSHHGFVLPLYCQLLSGWTHSVLHMRHPPSAAICLCRVPAQPLKAHLPNRIGCSGDPANCSRRPGRGILAPPKELRAREQWSLGKLRLLSWTELWRSARLKRDRTTSVSSAY